MSILDRTITFRTGNKRTYTLSNRRLQASLLSVYYKVNRFVFVKYDIFPADVSEKTEIFLKKANWFKSLSLDNQDEIIEMIAFNAYKNYHPIELSEFNMVEDNSNAELCNEFAELIILSL